MTNQEHYEELCEKAEKYAWHDIIKKPRDFPKEDGQYLVCSRYGKYYAYSMASFAKKLSKVDRYDFKGLYRKGFYDYDDKWGYYEKSNVIAWKLIELFEGEVEDDDSRGNNITRQPVGYGRRQSS